MDDVLAKVQEAFHVAFEIDSQSVTMDTHPDDVPEWDSMGHVALASSLERIFRISLDVDDLMEMENVQEIVRIIKSKLEPCSR
jgi:acyl carrier protein